MMDFKGLNMGLQHLIGASAISSKHIKVLIVRICTLLNIVDFANTFLIREPVIVVMLL